LEIEYSPSAPLRMKGASNIKANNDFRNAQDFVNSNGNTIGGAQVAVIAFRQGNNWYDIDKKKQKFLDNTISIMYTSKSSWDRTSRVCGSEST